MKAKFIGDPNNDGDGPKFGRMAYGPTGDLSVAYFPRDKFAGVPKPLEAKLSGNNHFETEDGDAPLWTPSEADSPRARAARAMDGNDDGKKGGSLTKKVTLERLAALKEKHPELEYDEAATLPVLRGALEEAEFAYGDEDDE